MATAYLFPHVLTSAEATALDGAQEVTFHADFPSTVAGGNWVASVNVEAVSTSTYLGLFIVSLKNVSGSGLDIDYATAQLGAVAGDSLRFHVMVQQVQ